jgi:bis(5'-nucleosyl)-tetraphosphatase (symmetrical)
VCAWSSAITICIWLFAGISRNKPKDRLKSLLEAPDADELLNWLRRQPLMQIDEEKKLVMAHAGITPQWDLETAKQCARDVEAVLASDSSVLPRCDVWRYAE